MSPPICFQTNVREDGGVSDPLKKVFITETKQRDCEIVGVADHQIIKSIRSNLANNPHMLCLSMMHQYYELV